MSFILYFKELMHKEFYKNSRSKSIDVHLSSRVKSETHFWKLFLKIYFLFFILFFSFKKIKYFI